MTTTGAAATVRILPSAILGIVHEALVYSNDDEIELLPALPESGFDRGTLTGLKTRNRATVTRLQWIWRPVRCRRCSPPMWTAR